MARYGQRWRSKSEMGAQSEMFNAVRKGGTQRERDRGKVIDGGVKRNICGYGGKWGGGDSQRKCREGI